MTSALPDRAELFLHIDTMILAQPQQISNKFVSLTLQEDLEILDKRFKRHEDNLAFLKSRIKHLDESIHGLKGMLFRLFYFLFLFWERVGEDTYTNEA